MNKPQRRSNMFPRLISRSLLLRWPRLAVATLAILLAALLVATLSSLTLDIGNKVGKELRAYGANIVISPRTNALAIGSGNLDFGTIASESYLSQSALAVLDEPGIAANLAGTVPYLYGVVDVAGQRLVLAGTQLDRVLSVSPWWNVAGDWPETGDRQGALVGSNVARELSLDIADPLAVQNGSRTAQLIVKGVVDTGGAEDNQVFVNLAVAQELLSRPEAVSLVQVSALTTNRPLRDTAEELTRALPMAEVKIAGQIADAEGAVFSKVQLLIALVAVLVLLAAALSVASTMTTTVLERTQEIGLLKALGASSGRVAALFLSEAATIGLAGGIVGYGAGVLVAQIIARSVFQADLTLRWQALPVTIGVAIGVALLAGIVPVRRAVAIDPAITLRGE